MLDQAVGFALERRGIVHQVAAYCEWESSAAATLIARMEEQSLEPSPVFCGDLRDFPAESFTGRIAGVTAGYPCQPYSVAGKQRGLRDYRSMGKNGDGPVHQMLRIIAIVRPAFVFLENVSAALKHFRPIGQRLEDIGYAIAPPLILAAEDVGAAHRRERAFILAYTPEFRQQWSAGAGREAIHRTAIHSGEMGDSASNQQWRDPESYCDGERVETGGSGSTVALAKPKRESIRPEQLDEARERPDAPTLDRPVSGVQSPGVFAPGPGDYARWESSLTHSPHLIPAIEPEVRVLVDGVAYVVDASRPDQLRQTGNGVVAIEGAVAFEYLATLITKP
jgi:DNA (cytosine-5)-methyltransferase 1